MKIARPRTMKWFDACFFGLLALIVINGALRWDMVVGMQRADAEAPGDYIEIIDGAAIAVVLGMLALIWHFAARRRSLVAMAILALIYAAMAAVGLYNFATERYSMAMTMWSSAAQIGLYLVSLGLLTLPSTRRWLKGKPEPQALRDTFS